MIFRNLGITILLFVGLVTVSACVVTVVENESPTSSEKVSRGDTPEPAEATPAAEEESAKSTPVGAAHAHKMNGESKDPVVLKGPLNIGTDPCETDADCVPEQCCHPKSCVARVNAPSCKDVMCTLILLTNTMDGGGHCVCHEGKCAAQLPRPRMMPVPK